MANFQISKIWVYYAIENIAGSNLFRNNLITNFCINDLYLNQTIHKVLNRNVDKNIKPFLFKRMVAIF